MNLKFRSASQFNLFSFGVYGVHFIMHVCVYIERELIGHLQFNSVKLIINWFQKTRGLISSLGMRACLCACFSLLWYSFISWCGPSLRRRSALPRWDLLFSRFMTTTSFESSASSGQRLQWRTSQSNCIMLRVMTFCPKQSSESHGCPSY